MLTFKNSPSLLALFLILGAAFVYLRYIEKRTLFYPTKELEFSPEDSGLGFQDIFFNTDDNLRLNGWFIPSDSAEYTVLFCHGNAGNISHRIDKIKFFHRLGCNVFIFDYRGYGRSQGSPSEKGLYIDAKSAYEYLLSRQIKEETIIGYGESLGSAVVIDLAYQNKMRALILEGAFSSGRDMVKYAYPFLPPWLVSMRLDSASKIKSIKAPKLIIHSLNDEIVPYALAQKLYRVSSEPKEFLEIRGGHNSCFYESEELLKQKVAVFLGKL